ncbi:MAG TPA: MarR family winged helix-turn-helix transcriptional regulator [Streptosporangiaceae bacterium]|nr:MarR family winged helix-turn-helix transcriptional regulator [Streptosporangiaceae bacterium]
MTELRRLFSDSGFIHARFVATVDLRLRKEFGLTLPLFDSMAAIEDVHACRVHDLAARLGMTSGGASKLVDRLGALGYCERRPNSGDRRSSLLDLTPAGRRLLAQAAPVVDDELDRLIGQVLSEPQVRELARIIRALRARID